MAEAVRLGLGPKLDSMAEKETVAPKTVATEKMVPFTMGTLDTKSIGLTSATIRPRAYCAKGGPMSARGSCGDGQATRAATQGAGYRLNGRRGHCRATRGPRL